MGDCKFCEALQLWKNIHSMNEPASEDLGKHKYEYTAALVIHHWYEKRGKRSASRTVDYRNRGLGFKLKFCPECGKKVK